MAAGRDAGMHARLERGAEQLGLKLSAAQLEALLAYQALLLKWNRVYNLTAIRSADEALTHHLLDSLSALPFLAGALGGTAGESATAGGRVLDVGSGGGLPGIPLAICCPLASVTLVDTVQKKTAFQTQVKAELRLDNVRPVAARVENLAFEAPGYAVITSRAFAELADFVSLAGHLLAPDGVFVAMKGVLPQQEIARLPHGWEVAQVQALSVPELDAERHLITIRRATSG